MSETQTNQETARQSQEARDKENPHVKYDERPWGSFTVLDEGTGYKVKRIEVLPGKRLSYQSHEHRAELWAVVQGQAVVTIDERDHTVEKNDSIDIPQKARHRVANKADEKLIFIEVQKGDYLGEDDITRYEDDFGRAT